MTGYPIPQPSATPTPDTLGHTTPQMDARGRAVHRSRPAVPLPHTHPAAGHHTGPPGEHRTPLTPRRVRPHPPSTTPPYARTASQHTYKNPDSNSPSNSFPSSPDTTDGTHAARSTSPQDTPNASVATRKKKPGTTSRGSPCTEDWTPSQTGTQPTPSHSTPDGRRGPGQPSNSPPSSSRRRYSRRSAGDSPPQPSTPCYAPTRRNPKPRRRTCNGRPLPRQRSSSHTAPTGTCSMQQPYPKQTKPTFSKSCSTNHENLPHDTPTRDPHHAYTPPTQHNTGTAHTGTTCTTRTPTSMRAPPIPISPRHRPSTGTTSRQPPHAPSAYASGYHRRPYPATRTTGSAWEPHTASPTAPTAGT